MKRERSVQGEETKGLLNFLARAPLDQVIPHAKISHFSHETLICTGDQLANCAYLILKGKCEHRRNSHDGQPQFLKSFTSGESFGGPAEMFPDGPATEVVAEEDSVVLGIRLEDLTRLAGETNGHEAASPAQKSADRNTAFFFTPPKGRLVTLAFLSGFLPAHLLSESVGRRLRAETGESTVLVELVAVTRPGSANEEVDCTLGGEVTLPLELRDDEFDLHLLRVGVPVEPTGTGNIAELFRRLRRRFRHVLVAVAAEQIPAPSLFECIAQSSAAHFCLRREPEDLYRLDLLLHELRPKLNSQVPVEPKAVLCLVKDEAVDGFDSRIENIGIPSPAFIRGCPLLVNPRDQTLHGLPTGSFHADVRRMARTIGDRLVGLALSSGAAKGLAHIGVIQVLEESGIEVDVVAGSSLGAYVGSIWSCGQDGTKLEALAREMEAPWAMWRLVDPAIPPRQGFLRGYAVKRRLKRSIGNAQFADLLRPLHVVATNLETLERVAFSTGDVATAVHASFAVPGICVPVRIGDDTFVDGGIVDPLPADILREMGVRRIIAVNTIPPPERIRYCLQAEREIARHTNRKIRNLARKFLPLNRQVNYFARGNILEILMRSIHGAQCRVATANGQLADIVLQPELCDDRWVDFRHPGPYIKAGREIALRRLDEIKTLIKRKGADHEYESSPQSMAALG